MLAKRSGADGMDLSSSGILVIGQTYDVSWRADRVRFIPRLKFLKSVKLIDSDPQPDSNHDLLIFGFDDGRRLSIRALDIVTIEESGEWRPRR